ncbi:MAG: response regulator [Candidatus Falkowbacteria bacterium]
MASAKKKILIVDDERAIAHALELKLGIVGFETATAPNGESALQYLSKESVDLVLMDLIMPKMDGFSVLEQMNREGIKTPVIILSNLSQQGDEKRAKDLGAKDFFIKSNITLAEVVEYVKKIL